MTKNMRTWNVTDIPNMTAATSTTFAAFLNIFAGGKND